MPMHKASRQQATTTMATINGVERRRRVGTPCPNGWLFIFMPDELLPAPVPAFIPLELMVGCELDGRFIDPPRWVPPDRLLEGRFMDPPARLPPEERFTDGLLLGRLGRLGPDERDDLFILPFLFLPFLGLNFVGS